MVARERGAKFTENLESGNKEPSTVKDVHIADKSLKDVIRWLGFRNRSKYLDVLPKERHNIFKRAIRKKNA